MPAAVTADGDDATRRALHGYPLGPLRDDLEKEFELDRGAERGLATP
jgi:hypothetical protein